MSYSQLDPILVDFSVESEALIIAFGSLQLNKVPPFEWTSILANVPARKIYIRDLYQLWYLKGLPGIANNPEGIRNCLQPLIAQQECKTIITVGGSMGGYAALLFGQLLEATEVHALAPQTFLPARKGRVLLKTIYGRAWPILRKQAELMLNRQLDRRYFDLRPFVKDNKHTVNHLYFSTENEKDTNHARHIGDLKNVQLHEFLDIGHHVGTHMRDNGELGKIFPEAKK